MSRAFSIIFVSLLIVYASYKVYQINNPSVADGASVTWQEMPVPARSTFMRYAEGGHVDAIIRGTKRDEVIYKADVTLLDGEKITLKADATGRLIGLKCDDENKENFGNNSTRYPTR